MAEAVRLNIQSAKAAGVPCVLNNVVFGFQRRSDQTYAQEFSMKNAFDFNLVHVNANRLTDFYRSVGPRYFDKKYTIGYWAWELPEFPKEWRNRFDFVDEVWTPSRFCLKALEAVSPVPVCRIPHPVEIDLDRRYVKADFGIKDDTYVFLFMFDFYSTFERKNPLAVIEAFKQAFDPNETVTLVLKFFNADINPGAWKRLAEQAAHHRIILLDNHLSRNETLGLLSIADAYVSLHRSEGFGLTIAEAMAFGKPVIATNYSGNTDFFDEKVGFPIKYSLRQLERDVGLYSKGNVWAEPNIDDAASWMRFVFDHQEVAQAVGRKAAESTQANLSPLRVGGMMKARLLEIVSALSEKDAA